jgi:hypothetical protein
MNEYRVRGKVKYGGRSVTIDSIVLAEDEEDAFQEFLWFRAESTYGIRYPEFAEWVDGPRVRPLSESERMELTGAPTLFAMENV